MRPILTDRVAWSDGLSVGLSVCHTSEPCKNGCTDRAAFWVVDLGGPGEPCVRWGSRSPHGKGQIFWGDGRPIVKYRDTLRSSVQRRLNIGMPFGLWARMGRRNHVLDGGPKVLRAVAIATTAIATNFGTQFAITGFGV